MKRVIILGAPGVGKTTFAKQLGKKTGLPVFHLDYFYHQKSTDFEHNREAWIKFVEDLTAKSAWITDGNYRPTLPARVKAADTIFFLDFPRWRSLKGVYKRRIKHQTKQREEMPAEWRERMNLPFFKFVWKFNGQYRQDLMDAVKNKDIITFTTPKEIKRYLQGLSNY